MINSLLMLGSTAKNNKKINIIFAIFWILYMLINSNFKTGLIFVFLNIIAFAFTFMIGKLIKGKYANTIVSVMSILIWSIVMDILCYIFIPRFTNNISIFSYVWNGILFNYKYVFTNVLALAIVNKISLLFKNLNVVNEKQKLVN